MLHGRMNEMPIHPRAMLKTGDMLFVGGAETTNQLLGKSGGGSILVVSSADGTQLGTLQLSAPPVFDGLSAAGGKLFVSQQDGKLFCFGE